jgi:hypothetical protein
MNYEYDIHIWVLTCITQEFREKTRLGVWHPLTLYLRRWAHRNLPGAGITQRNASAIVIGRWAPSHKFVRHPGIDPWEGTLQPAAFASTPWVPSLLRNLEFKAIPLGIKYGKWRLFFLDLGILLPFWKKWSSKISTGVQGQARRQKKDSILKQSTRFLDSHQRGIKYSTTAAFYMPKTNKLW